MAGRVSPHHNELRQALRTRREAANLTGQELAALLGCKQPKISKTESGALVPTPEFVRDWAKATTTSPGETATLTRLARAVARDPWSWNIAHDAGLAQREKAVSQAETVADAIRQFHPMGIPDLLQTADYARHILAISSPVNSTDAARAWNARLERQAILAASGRTFRFVLTQAALRFRPGTVESMAAQRDRLLSIMTLPHVELGIVPDDARAPARFLNAFAVFDSEDPVVLVETYGHDLWYAGASQIQLHERLFDQLTTVTVSGSAAIELIRAELAD